MFERMEIYKTIFIDVVQQYFENKNTILHNKCDSLSSKMREGDSQ